jgi:hypothetical protein
VEDELAIASKLINELEPQETEPVVKPRVKLPAIKPVAKPRRQLPAIKPKPELVLRTTKDGKPTKAKPPTTYDSYAAAATDRTERKMF